MSNDDSILCEGKDLSSFPAFVARVAAVKRDQKSPFEFLSHWLLQALDSQQMDGHRLVIDLQISFLPLISNSCAYPQRLNGWYRWYGRSLLSKGVIKSTLSPF
ncbi:hypothetical protein D5R40_32445 [Okeania hirsuta]|uniref:Uncharacterized protein n=1 Tax=Okeania hirsuta TaxID=1458930 RepID=A0A3N6NRP0_9CYAN|nr:hypothetical protein D5R40_32445 [Okeania hirsuta]